MKKGGVYTIRNTVNGRIYVGGTTDLGGRWRTHKVQLRNARHPAKRLLTDFWEMGLQALSFEILEEVPEGGDLHAAEQRHIDQLRPYDPAIGYNTHPRADSPMGVTRTRKTRQRMAAAHVGEDFTPERRANISAGRKASPRAAAAMKSLNATKRALTITEVQRVVEMRRGGAPVQAIADEFGVSRRPIRAILDGETYTEITGIQPKPKRI